MYPYCSIILAHTEFYFIPPHKELCPRTEREILYNTYQEMAIWKSIATLIYRELLALGREIGIFKFICRYLLAVGR
jgi:hypothetical protein